MRSPSKPRTMLADTKQGDPIAAEKPKQLNGLSPEQMAGMERELEVVSRDFKAVEQTFGDDVPHLSSHRGMSAA